MLQISNGPFKIDWSKAFSDVLVDGVRIRLEGERSDWCASVVKGLRK